LAFKWHFRSLEITITITIIVSTGIHLLALLAVHTNQRQFLNVYMLTFELNHTFNSTKQKLLYPSVTPWQPNSDLLLKTLGLGLDPAFMKRMMPCAWLLSDTLEVWSLRLITPPLGGINSSRKEI